MSEIETTADLSTALDALDAQLSSSAAEITSALNDLVAAVNAGASDLTPFVQRIKDETGAIKAAGDAAVAADPATSPTATDDTNTAEVLPETPDSADASQVAAPGSKATKNQ